MTPFEMITSRRSIRRYAEEKIPLQTLLDLCSAGLAGPTSYDTKHTIFIPIDDQNVLIQLRDHASNTKILKHNAIAVCSDLNKAYGGWVTPYWIQDCSAAAQNICLAANSLGLGACWLGIWPREERVKMVQRALDLPDNVFPLCLISLGYPDEKLEPKNPERFGRVFINSYEVK